MVRRPSTIVLDMTDLLRRVEIAETERAELTLRVQQLELENGTLTEDLETRCGQIETLERKMRERPRAKGCGCGAGSRLRP